MCVQSVTLLSKKQFIGLFFDKLRSHYMHVLFILNNIKNKKNTKHLNQNAQILIWKVAF